MWVFPGVGLGPAVTLIVSRGDTLTLTVEGVCPLTETHSDGALMHSQSQRQGQNSGSQFPADFLSIGFARLLSPLTLLTWLDQ